MTSPTPHSQTQGGELSLSYDKLVAVLKECKARAVEIGAGSPPAGYDELEGEPLRIADECWRDGMDAVETALLNWAYDELNAPHSPPVSEATKGGEWARLSRDELLQAVAHISIDPCDPSQDSMSAALGELARRYESLTKAVETECVSASQDDGKRTPEQALQETNKELYFLKVERDHYKEELAKFKLIEANLQESCKRLTADLEDERHRGLVLRDMLESPDPTVVPDPHFYDWIDRAAAEWNRIYGKDSTPEQRLLDAQKIKNVIVQFGPHPQKLTAREIALRETVSKLEHTLEAYRKRARKIYTAEDAAKHIGADEARMRDVDKQLEVALAVLKYFGLEVTNELKEGDKMLLTPEDKHGISDCAYVRVIPGGEWAKDHSELMLLREMSDQYWGKHERDTSAPSATKQTVEGGANKEN